ncbi:helix-turn-helix domain-containing protein [Deinococcus murrayi]|uniref:helix-turn-helix domain-containing protein n=1 Tax=Deinococcus murrayi TaxID=68910 RepID=UPI000A0439EF|nr:helix-turn-helix domain-containing protein [Deinococcus murrayi]
MVAPFLPTAADTQAAQAQLERLRQQAGSLPRHLSEFLEDLLRQLAAGKAIQIVTLDPEMTTQQAADLLNVSRPYVVKLVEAGELPHRKVGPRRRLYLEDVLAYKARLDAQQQEALQALADDLQEMGLD